MENNLFVIIVTYNGEQWIRKCLNSIIESSIKSFIIVVDNKSTDSTLPIIKKDFRDVVLIENEENLGFGKANNIGIEKGLALGGEYFLLLNQDAYLQKETLESLVSKNKKNKNQGIISPIHLDGSGNQLDIYFQSYISPPNCKNLYSDIFLKKKLKALYNVDFINAAIWLLSRQTIKKVGGFNPYFFHYAEDNDYINRCKYKGLKVSVDPHSYAYHDRLQKKRKTTANVLNNIRDVKLMNPNNNIDTSRMLNLTFKKLVKSLITLNKSNLKDNFKYFKKIYKNRTIIREIINKVKNDDYAFLNYKE
ncbi:glycosyltransferase family 2 protein [Sabulilitoribacter arenilitoris]|uniref:Glycosyltransferase family 2 protein n=1 Tax=Wocania arenilitoris TaxID=2044858 RepID=A0AAE3EQD7_9FLAO|nr:glycosyltransferase family 2 protein [Wocania arenilitoris]MCF7568953.1 glycosyltransferase family 2 protein [Wocania arenilitoris]